MKTNLLPLVIAMIQTFAAPARAQSISPLDQHLGALDLRHTTAASATNLLSHETGLRISVAWDPLGGDDARNTNIDLSLNGCRVRDALRAMFPAAEIYEDAGTIYVTAKDAAPVSTRTYPIFDVLRLFGPGHADDLIELVENCVRSDDWADNGGRFQLRLQGGLLVAQQTPEGHESLTRLLDLLRNAAAARNNPVAPRPARPTALIASRRLTDLRFRQAPLDAVILDLLATAHVPHLINWQTLETNGIPFGTPLTLDLSGVSLAESLAIISELTNVHFILHDGAVELNIPESLSNYYEPRVFDMRPMAAVVRDYVAASPGWRATVNAQGVADAVLTTVEGAIAIDSWKDNGGTAACRQAGDLLVVTNTPETQDQIAAMLSDIQAASQPASQPAPPAQKPDPLEARLDPIDLRETTLDDALDRLGQRTETQILVDWRSLESAGVDRNTPVSVKLRGGPLRSALNVILELATNGDNRLDYRLDESGIIHVGTADSLGHIAVTRIYNIRDLISKFLDYRNVPPTAPDRQEAARQDAIDSITKLIEDTIDTDSWKDNGGSVGALREFAGLLIVTNTAQSHLKIKSLLDSLRTQTSLGTK